MFKRFCLTALVLIGVLSMFGATQESQIKLQTVFEKTFSDTIVDVIFDTATVSLSEAKAMGWKTDLFSATEKAKGKVNVAYAKVVFYGIERDRQAVEVAGIIPAKKIIFYSPTGRIKKTVDLGWLGIESKYYITVSPNKKYIAVSNKFEKFRGNDKGAMLFDSDGNELVSFEKGQIFWVSNKGYFIYTSTTWEFDGFNPPLCVYDLNKNKRLDYKDLSVLIPHAEVGGCVFVGEGDYVFLWNSLRGKTKAKLVEVSSGTVKWEREYNFEIRGRWRATAGRERVGIFGSGEGGIFCLDWNTGDVKWRHRLPAPFHAIIMDEQNNIYVGSNLGYLASFSIEGKQRWYYEDDEHTKGLIRGLFQNISLGAGNILWAKETLFNMRNSSWDSSVIIGISGNGKIGHRQSSEGKAMLHTKDGKVGLITGNRGIKFLVPEQGGIK